MTTYTAVLLSNTAVPSWHEAHEAMPILFAGSAMAAGGGITMALTPVAEAGPSRRVAVAGAAIELAAAQKVEHGHGIVDEPFHEGRAGTLLKAAKALTGAGAILAAAGRRRRDVSALAGISLLAGSVCTRFGLFEAGQQSARDPRYTVVPQRERLDRHARAHTPA
jgi:polysulfide reductase-like protein